MAALSDSVRRQIWAQFMRDASSAREGIALSKTELRAAVDALDTWIDDNAAAVNAAIPQPARNNLTAAQKALLFSMIALRRYSG